MGTKRTIIHIGFPRCGSTLLQQWIFPQLDGDTKIVSPASADRRLIDFLNEQFIFPGRNIHLTPVTEAEKSRVAEIIAEYAEPTVLVSCEGLVGDSFDNMLPLPHLAAALRDLFGEPEILVIIRRQVDMARSYYRYAVEEGYYRSYPRFLGYMNGRFAGFQLQRYAGVNVDPRALDFRNFVGFLEASFGPNKVHVLPYEWINRDFDRFCLRLSGILGVKLPAANNVPPVVNRGVHQAELVLLKALNRVWDTRIAGIPLLPKQPFLEYLNLKCQTGGIGMRLLRAISSRTSPLGLLRLVGPVISPVLNLVFSAFAITGLKSDVAIEKAVNEAVFESNFELNRHLDGVLTGLGYCDRH